MFVRFRQSSHRLQLSLVEPRRENAKVRQEHIASLGALPLKPGLGEKTGFWKRLFERLERLANRLDDETRNKIIEAVLARVPMPTEKERREHFKQREAVWKVLHVRSSATLEENQIRREDADKKIAAAESITAMAQSELQQIEEERACMERGEGLPPIGWMPSLKDLGITSAFASHAEAMASLTEEQFERFLKFGRRNADLRRGDYARLRRFLRNEAKRRPQP